MHTYFPSDTHVLFRERRLCFLEKNVRHDLLEEAMRTQGKMERKDLVKEMESNTEKILKDITDIPVHWKEWCRNFFRTSAVIEKKTQQRIMEAAEERIREQSDLAIGKIRGLFSRGKRRLYLLSREKIAEQIRSDLYRYLESKRQESLEREGKFNRLANSLRASNEPILLESDVQHSKLMTALRGVENRMKGNVRTIEKKGAAVPKEWAAAQETEQMLRQQFLKFGIVDASGLDTYLERNAQGDNGLRQHIASTPALDGENELRRCLLNALKELQRGNARYYRLQRQMEADPNTGTLASRLSHLRTGGNILGRTLRLSLAGNDPIDTYPVYRGEGYLVLQQGREKRYCILDLESGEVTYRDASGGFHDYRLKESSFSLI